MGRNALSSRRKHSKKKTRKVSYEAGRKKSRRNKSKKLRHNDDSFSSCSDDESTTSSSLVSSSSSEGEYRSRRARSRSRNEAKGSKKRTRGRSLSEDSSKDSPPVKKRKASKKKRDSEKRKKTKKIKKKKKSRRDAYISSASSDSVSCSTCRDGDSSSDEGASHGRPRVRSREEKKDPEARNGHRKNSSRNRSPSPSKLSDSYDNESIEKMVVENNSRRLKSVITVAKPPEDEEGNDMRKDEPKEEIVYDYDDYPSCKSNDSNDGESKKELVDRSNVSPDKRRMPTSVTGELNSASSLNDNESLAPGKSASKEFVGSKEKDSNASGNTGSEVDNLESILRQKALENLSRFRGGLQTKAVAPVDDKQENNQRGVNQSTSASANLVQTQKGQPAPEQDAFSTMAVMQPAIQRSRFTWRRDPSVTTGKEEKAAAYSRVDSGKSQAPAPKIQSANVSSTSSEENKIGNETSKIITTADNNIGGVRTNEGQMSSAAAKTPSSVSTEEGSSKEQQTETHDNSQFEKKTMSVMRGGEMVQVSYKVYIPNRAPALARRQLKR